MAKFQADFIIIGGGVAGLTAAQYAARSNLKTLVIEKSLAGGQALSIDKIENYPGFPNAISGFSFSEEMKKQAQEFGAEFVTDNVTMIDKKNNEFIITGEENQYFAQAVLLASGAKHRKLNIPGEEEFSGKGVSWCATCDGPFFKNKQVFIAGGGDAACDDALYLTKLGCTVTIVHRRERLRAQKALAERTLANPKVSVLFNSRITEIKGGATVNSVNIENVLTKETKEYSTSAVFILIGMDPVIELVDAIKKDENSHIITNENMETSLTGLFCAGDVRAKPFRQLITAASDGAIAAHSVAIYIDKLNGKAY